MLKSEFNAKYDNAIRAIAMEEDKDMVEVYADYKNVTD